MMPIQYSEYGVLFSKSKNKKIVTPEILAVIMLNFEQSGFTI